MNFSVRNVFVCITDMLVVILTCLAFVLSNVYATERPIIGVLTQVILIIFVQIAIFIIVVVVINTIIITVLPLLESRHQIV